MVEARKQAGVTQAQLARKLGRPQSFVSKYELGERRLDIIEFLDVAAALSISPARLLAELEARKPPESHESGSEVAKKK
jgi:transcriptional regulator with XRE-family HTH domain